MWRMQAKTSKSALYSRKRKSNWHSRRTPYLSTESRQVEAQNRHRLVCQFRSLSLEVFAKTRLWRRGCFRDADYQRAVLVSQSISAYPKVRSDTTRPWTKRVLTVAALPLISRDNMLIKIEPAPIIVNACEGKATGRSVSGDKPSKKDKGRCSPISRHPQC